MSIKDIDELVARSNKAMGLTYFLEHPIIKDMLQMVEEGDLYYCTFNSYIFY